jgi:hypothetical protein
MSLLTFNKENWVVEPTAEALVVDQFKKIVSRDKSKDKNIAKKELAFIYFYADVKSDHFGKSDSDKFESIKLEVSLPKDWIIDEDLQIAIDFYKNRNQTINSTLYESAVISAREISSYLKDTKKLLEERTDKGAAVTNINTITGALQKVPQIMSNLNDAYKELVKEQLFSEGKKKGSREFNLFEQGL